VTPTGGGDGASFGYVVKVFGHVNPPLKRPDQGEGRRDRAEDSDGAAVAGEGDALPGLGAADEGGEVGFGMGEGGHKDG
jgi:hypothetical protein